MDIVIVNTSKLRVALSKLAKEQNTTSVTAMLNANNMNSSLIAKAENRFNSYSDKVRFEIDEYTTYGAFYEDIWKQIIALSSHIRKEDFELERFEKVSESTSKYRELDSRITKLEDTVLNLMKLVEELRRQ
mgnify:FL=1|jgi:hypothetical protein|nr:MAG TPA: hypothetical protein [Bacteriophage sp.]